MIIYTLYNHLYNVIINEYMQDVYYIICQLQCYIAN
jgi:hypothetical protein